MFQRFLSSENLQLAWKRLTHSIRLEVKDWLGLQVYAPQIETHIQILQDALRSDYCPSEACPFYKTKQDRSLRRFAFLSMDDRLVYQAICNILIENSYDDVDAKVQAGQLFSNVPTPPDDKSPYVFRRVFTSRGGAELGQYDLYRERVLRSYGDFRERHEDAWLVRADVRSYFPSIDHQRLLDLFADRKWLPDERLQSILCKCLAKWEHAGRIGIPIGARTTEGQRRKRAAAKAVSCASGGAAVRQSLHELACRGASGPRGQRLRKKDSYRITVAARQRLFKESRTSLGIPISSPHRPIARSQAP